MKWHDRQVWWHFPTMSVIDDTRKLLQDLVAPDLKAIQVQLTSMDKSIQMQVA